MRPTWTEAGVRPASARAVAGLRRDGPVVCGLARRRNRLIRRCAATGAAPGGGYSLLPAPPGGRPSTACSSSRDLPTGAAPGCAMAVRGSAVRDPGSAVGKPCTLPVRRSGPAHPTSPLADAVRPRRADGRFVARFRDVRLRRSTGPFRTPRGRLSRIARTAATSPNPAWILDHGGERARRARHGPCCVSMLPRPCLLRAPRIWSLSPVAVSAERWGGPTRGDRLLGDTRSDPASGNSPPAGVPLTEAR